MFRDHAPSGFRNTRVGYGWNLTKIRLRESGREVTIQHAPGNNAGFTAVLYRVPKKRWTIALIQNTGPAHLDMRIFDICAEVVHALRWRTATNPADRHGRPCRVCGQT